MAGQVPAPSRPRRGSHQAPICSHIITQSHAVVSFESLNVIKCIYKYIFKSLNVIPLIIKCLLNHLTHLCPLNHFRISPLLYLSEFLPVSNFPRPQGATVHPVRAVLAEPLLRSGSPLRSRFRPVQSLDYISRDINRTEVFPVLTPSNNSHQ